MKLWKKAVSVLLGFCMMIGGLALAPKMDVRAAGPVPVSYTHLRAHET